MTEDTDLKALTKYSKSPLSRRASTMARNHKAGIRTARHGKFKIEIATRYAVQVNGRKVPMVIEVGPDGSVSCHDIPHYITASAVDLVKAVIDAYPERFASSAKGKVSPRPKPKSDRSAKPRRKGR